MTKYLKTLILLIVTMTLLGDARFGGQANQDMSLTDCEKDEAVKVAQQFSKQLQEKKDLNLIWNSLFVKDFIERHLQDPVNYALPLLEREVANQISRQALRNYYVQSANLEYFTDVYFASKFHLRATKQETNSIDEMYPDGVATLVKQLYFTKDPVIRNVKQFQSVVRIMTRAVRIFRDYLSAHPVETTALYKENLEYLEQEPAFMKPSLSVCEEACFGFSPGTRMFIVDVPFCQLLLVKIEGQMKIINVASD